MHPVLKFIYGDNKYGRCLLSYFQSIGMHIDYFVQSEDLNCKNTVDTPLISYSEMIKIAGKKIIYVAIEDNNDITELKRKLSKYSKSIKVYICNKFIREKLLIESDKSRYCIICNNYIKEFKPSGIDGDIFMSHHIIGGGYRKDCILFAG